MVGVDATALGGSRVVCHKAAHYRRGIVEGVVAPEVFGICQSYGTSLARIIIYKVRVAYAALAVEHDGSALSV